MQQEVEVRPARGGDFRVRLECGTVRQGEDVRPDGDRGQDRRAGHHVVQTAEEVGVGEREAHLLLGLADGGGDQIEVDILAASAGERHVAGPWIARALGAANQQHRVGRRHEHDRHGRPQERRVVVRDRPVNGEAGPEPRETRAQWLCE